MGLRRRRTWGLAVLCPARHSAPRVPAQLRARNVVVCTHSHRRRTAPATYRLRRGRRGGLLVGGCNPSYLPTRKEVGASSYRAVRMPEARMAAARAARKAAGRQVGGRNPSYLPTRKGGCCEVGASEPTCSALGRSKDGCGEGGGEGCWEVGARKAAGGWARLTKAMMAAGSAAGRAAEEFNPAAAATNPGTATGGRW